MRLFHRHSVKVLSLALICSHFWTTLAQTPAIIDETVPPASDHYALGPDSLAHPGVPAGKTFQFEIKNSKIFPGTTRTLRSIFRRLIKATNRLVFMWDWMDWAFVPPLCSII